MEEIYNLESPITIRARVKEFLDKIINSEYNNIIIISHRGVINELMGLICNLDYYAAAFDSPKGIFVDNTGNCFISYIQYDQKNFKLITAPNNEHLNLFHKYSIRRFNISNNF